MRIVAGSARGRKLVAPDSPTTRPTSDRVREAIFNTLFSLDDAVADATVLDLFAGSGALGFEALSRGAAHVTFVERDRRALAVLERNIDGTGTDRAAITVVRTDALDWLQTQPRSPAVGRPPAPGAPAFDIALLDPPYDFDAWPALLAAVPATLVVIESNRDITTEVASAGTWETIRHRRYGGTVVTMVRRLPPA
jgi:16S rRNA (guanine966-N2)-methyltransferase